MDKITPAVFFVICLFTISACSIHTKADYSTNIVELQKHIGLTFQPSSAQWKRVDLSKGRNSNTFIIYATLTYADLDSLISCSGPDIQHDIYIAQKVVDYSVARSIKNSIYLENKFYRLNTSAYSISSIVKSPFLTGYFFRTADNQLFIVVQSESNSGV